MFIRNNKVTEGNNLTTLNGRVNGIKELNSANVKYQIICRRNSGSDKSIQIEMLEEEMVLL